MHIYNFMLNVQRGHFHISLTFLWHKNQMREQLQNKAAARWDHKVCAGFCRLCHSLCCSNSWWPGCWGRWEAWCSLHGHGVCCGQTAIVPFAAGRRPAFKPKLKAIPSIFHYWSSLTPSKRRIGWSSCRLRAPHKLPFDHEKELWIVFGTRDVAGHPEKANYWCACSWHKPDGTNHTHFMPPIMPPPLHCHQGLGWQDQSQHMVVLPLLCVHSSAGSASQPGMNSCFQANVFELKAH